MKILLWSPYGAGTHFWGPGTSAFRLYKEGLPENYSVTLVHASEQQGKFPDVYSEQVKLPTLENATIFGKIRYFFAARMWIAKNYKRFDVIHGITVFEYTFRPMLQFAKAGKPTFIKVTGHNSGLGNSSVLSRMMGIAGRRIKSLNNISGYLAVSEAIEKNLIKYGVRENKIFRIPNGVDTSLFIPLNDESKTKLRRELGIHNKFTFIYLGGLTENKRVLDITQACAFLRKAGIAIQFLIVGPDRSRGKVRGEILDIIKINDLEDCIVLIDKTDTPHRYLQVADAFLLPSISEGMSNALLEAMSCALPCIVTPISGSKDLIEDRKNGLLTNGQMEDIAAKMQMLYDNQLLAKNLGYSARKLVEESYSSKQTLLNHLKMFNNSGLC